MRRGYEPARVLVADPAWQFKDKLMKRGAASKYRAMRLEDIMRFALPALADDCVLFLWRVSSQVEEAYRVVRAWGFEPKSEMVWKKLTVKGNRHFGNGRYVRAEHETVIIARRGRPERLVRNVRSMFEAPVGRHSAKPPEFFRIVERLYAGPYTELFGRELRPGWRVYGDEVNSP